MKAAALTNRKRKNLTGSFSWEREYDRVSGTLSWTLYRRVNGQEYDLFIPVRIDALQRAKFNLAAHKLQEARRIMRLEMERLHGC